MNVSVKVPGFGPDNGEVRQHESYAAIAETVRNIKPRALTRDQTDDVLTLLEYMHAECLAQHDGNIAMLKRLDERERELQRREREAALKHRAAMAVLKAAKPGWRNLWR
jgi:hypothetical protein